MNDTEKKSLSVYLIAVTVILSNLFILSVFYQVPLLSTFPAVKKVLSLISLTAIYPYELFQHFLREDPSIHFYWIFLVMLSAFGLMFFVRIARNVFIVFNIMQFVILGVLMVSYWGQLDFGEYFFKTYFNMVVFILYIGYLTIPEIRQQFLAPAPKVPLESWVLKLKRKTLGPKDAIGYFNLALAYKKLGRVDEALEYLDRALTILPQRADFHFAVGEILLDRLVYSKAIRFFQETVELDPLHVRARFYLGQAYQRTGCLQEAAQSFRRCTFLDPHNGEFFRHLGITCYHSGHWDDAQQAFRKGAELAPYDHQCYFYLGLIASKDKAGLPQAEEYFKKAVRLSPDFVEAYRELGHYYVAVGDYKGAVRAFRDVLRLDPGQPQAHYQLGFAYAMINDMVSARREHKILKDIDPDLAQTLGLLFPHS